MTINALSQRGVLLDSMEKPMDETFNQGVLGSSPSALTKKIRGSYPEAFCNAGMRYGVRATRPRTA
jgi:hypothetical protein